MGTVTLQILRRTFSTPQKKVGLKDIQAQICHAGPNTTAGIYMQSIPAQQQCAMIGFEELMLGGTGGSIQ